jgi:phosphoribosyl-ATP pyrophosphohydrolase
MDILAELDQVLDQRKGETPDSSYVASLYAKGINKMLEKVGEEATEVILAAKDAATSGAAGHRHELTKEIADLWFHTLVVLNHLDLSSDDVLKELASRFDISGLDEKASRTR